MIFGKSLPHPGSVSPSLNGDNDDDDDDKQHASIPQRCYKCRVHAREEQRTAPAPQQLSGLRSRGVADPSPSGREQLEEVWGCQGTCFSKPRPFPHPHPRLQIWGPVREQSGCDRPSVMGMVGAYFNSLHVVQIIPSGCSKSQAFARAAQQLMAEL